MRKLTTLLCMCMLSYALAQNAHEPSNTNPYGSKNPAAASQLDDFKPMIGCAIVILKVEILMELGQNL